MPMTIPEQVIQSLIVWIDENIHRQLHIDDIAKHAGYSKWHLQRIFVHYRGETLARYVRSRRLEIVAEELLCSDERVLDICLKYGFESQQTLHEFLRAISNSHQACGVKLISTMSW